MFEISELFSEFEKFERENHFYFILTAKHTDSRTYKCLGDFLTIFTEGIGKGAE